MICSIRSQKVTHVDVLTYEVAQRENDLIADILEVFHLEKGQPNSRNLLIQGHRCLHFSWVIQVKTHNDQRITKEESTNWNLSLNMPGWIIVFSLLLMFVLKTVHRNSEWQTKERLARSGLKVNPTNAKIHVTLGNVLANKVCINKKTGKLRSRQVGRLRRIKRPSGHISTESS